MSSLFLCCLYNNYLLLPLIKFLLHRVWNQFREIYYICVHTIYLVFFEYIFIHPRFFFFVIIRRFLYYYDIY